MKQEDIIRMAREAGFYGQYPEAYNIVMIERFAALVAAAENEACAKVCESSEEYPQYFQTTSLSAAIRARGQA